MRAFSRDCVDQHVAEARERGGRCGGDRRRRRARQRHIELAAAGSAAARGGAGEKPSRIETQGGSLRIERKELDREIDIGNAPFSSDQDARSVE